MNGKKNRSLHQATFSAVLCLAALAAANTRSKIAQFNEDMIYANANVDVIQNTLRREYNTHLLTLRGDELLAQLPIAYNC